MSTTAAAGIMGRHDNNFYSSRGSGSVFVAAGLHIHGAA